MHFMILLCVLATLLSMLFLIFFLVCLSSRLPSSFLFRTHVAIASAFIFPLAFAFSLPSLFLTGILTAGHWLTSVIPSHRSVCAQVVAGVEGIKDPDQCRTASSLACEAQRACPQSDAGRSAQALGPA